MTNPTPDLSALIDRLENSLNYASEWLSDGMVKEHRKALSLARWSITAKEALDHYAKLPVIVTQMKRYGKEDETVDLADLAKTAVSQFPL